MALTIGDLTKIASEGGYKAVQRAAFHDELGKIHEALQKEGGVIGTMVKGVKGAYQAGRRGAATVLKDGEKATKGFAKTQKRHLERGKELAPGASLKGGQWEGIKSGCGELGKHNLGSIAGHNITGQTVAKGVGVAGLGAGAIGTGYAVGR